MAHGDIRNRSGGVGGGVDSIRNAHPSCRHGHARCADRRASHAMAIGARSAAARELGVGASTRDGRSPADALLTWSFIACWHLRARVISTASTAGCTAGAPPMIERPPSWHRWESACERLQRATMSLPRSFSPQPCRGCRSWEVVTRRTYCSRTSRTSAGREHKR